MFRQFTEFTADFCHITVACFNHHECNGAFVDYNNSDLVDMLCLSCCFCYLFVIQNFGKGCFKEWYALISMANLCSLRYWTQNE